MTCGTMNATSLKGYLMCAMAIAINLFQYLLPLLDAMRAIISDHCCQKRRLRFFSLKGDVDIYKLPSGERIDSAKDSKFSAEGQLTFVITGPDTAMMYANQGASEIKAFRDDSSIVLLETTPSGSRQVTIIQHRWNKKHRGFEYTHIRNTVKIAFADFFGREF